MESSGSRRAGSALLLSVMVLAAGCTSAQPPAAQTGQSPASQVPSASAQPSPLTAAQPSPSASAPSASASAQPSSPASAQPPEPASIRALAARYLAIAQPANHRLDVEVNGFRDHQRDDLAKAAADLRAEAATERHFDRQLARIRFPAAIEAIARALIRANRSRIALTHREARSASLAELKTFTRRHKAADAAVEIPVKALRKALGLPPPETS
jgi:hypothetical protein